MNRTIIQVVLTITPEKWTGFGTFIKDFPVVVEMIQERGNHYQLFFSGILIHDTKRVIAILFDNPEYLAEVTATFPALKTFKRQYNPSCYGIELLKSLVLMKLQYGLPRDRISCTF